jgi:primosomal protein N' (replication factor Y)
MTPLLSHFARVVPELSLDKAFDYAVPENLRGKIALGSKVKAPFGAREITGYVVDLPETPQVAKIKPLHAVVGDRPYIPSHLIELARWMADYYCCPLGQALRAVLPEAVRKAEVGFKQRLWVEPVAGLDSQLIAAQLAKTKSQRLAWEALQSADFGTKSLQGGWLTELCHQTRTTAAVWRALEQKGYVRIAPATRERNPFAPLAKASAPHTLEPEQANALRAIQEEAGSPRPKVVLLHGVTGSGKTEVYLQAIAMTLRQNKSALVLVPEIALTPQTVERFRARFLGQPVGVAVLHSHLSAGERHDQWHQIHSGRAQIVIGARSAIFAPLENLGLIVVDEEHEYSYKQEESPHYNARDVAVMRGHLEKIPVVLGSATPSLESFHHAQEGKYRLCPLTRRVEVQSMPTIHIIDMRQEFKKIKKQNLISQPLASAISDRLAKKEQVIIFLNRRGFASSLQCPQCGHVEQCPRCSLPLTFHRTASMLRCHLCDHAARAPASCPSCHFHSYNQRGAGTEKVEVALAQLFPQANIVRMDSDTMRSKNAYNDTLSAFAAGKIDILVGTQMIAKGLHFPNVTCVGVINADLALHLPDFRASERVFQLLMQVSGRSGRGEAHGEVFVQTQTPFHPAIQFARHHDYSGFSEQELEFRKALQYPPYQRAILITWRGRSEEKTAFVARQTAKKIADMIPPDSLLTGPAPAPIAKINEYYRYHLFLRAKKLPPLCQALRPIFMQNSWPEGIKATIDIDPMALL